MGRTVVRKLTDIETGVCQTLVQRKREAELRCAHGEAVAQMARQDITSIAIALKGLASVMHGSHSDTLGLDLDSHELYEDVEEDTTASLAEAIQANIDRGEPDES